jgi:hypothetical protein
MIKTVAVNDFTGGLNYRADPFQLADNESPDLLNVNIDPRGGFSSRAGMRRYISQVDAILAGQFNPRRLYSWAGNTSQLILSANTLLSGKVYYTEGTTWADTLIPCSFSEGASMAPWSNSNTSYLYFGCGHDEQGHKWNGTTATALTASGAAQWQDSYASPTGTHMPKANLIATHVDRMWVANTNEDSNVYPDRVRFSHPGFPESWRELDYIDVVGGGKGITALVSFGDQLLVFKKDAIYAILGYDEETFQVIPLTTTLGCVSSNAIAVSESGVFFFSWPDGLFVYNGEGFTDLFVPLRPLISSGELLQNLTGSIHVAWVDRKVHVSLPVGRSPFALWRYDSGIVSYPGSPVPEGNYDDDEIKYDGDIRATLPQTTFVWDSTIREGGAWTQYQTADGYGLVGGANFTDADGRRIPVCAHPYRPYVLKINQEDFHTDLIHGSEQNYDSYYTTKWQDAGESSARKFWRRPEVVLRQFSEETTIDVDVYHDWDKSSVDRQFSIGLDAVAVGGGGGSWVEPDLGSDMAKGNNLGLANSVQLKISGTGKRWGVNGIFYKFNPRRVRT